MIVFDKMQAVGNDFVVIDATKGLPIYNLKVLTRFICDRHIGIGADGVIFFEYSRVADFKMRIFNSDGTEAEMCGNGIRCLAKKLYNHKYIEKEEFSIETLAGIKKVKIYISETQNEKIEINMGEVLFGAKSRVAYLPRGFENSDFVEVKYKEEIFKLYLVSVGNPHSVCFVNDFNFFNFEEVGKFIENYKYFPSKTNVEFVQIKNKNSIVVKVWERGVGRTLGCGTGAIASATASIKNKFTESDVIVDLEGGKVEIKEINNEMYLIGDAKFVYEGKILDL